MRTEDGYIIYKCLNGEPGAFGILIDKYKAGIFAFTYDKLCNFQDAEDVTQEVFERAYRNLRSLRRWESFAAWLYRIASNQCGRLFQVRSRRPDSKFTEDQDPKFLEKPSLDAYRDSQIDESLREALDSLSRIYREVLVLHYFGGMTIKDIARAIGASPTAIGVRLNRARAQLREEMLAMMDTTFEGQRLQASFTFRIVEAVKRMKIQSTPRMTGLPWGISLAAGIILAVLSLGSHLNLTEPVSAPVPSPPGETKVIETGEVPVDILSVSQMRLMDGIQGKGNSQKPGFSSQQNAPLLAPHGEGDIFPDEPSARLGKGMTRFGDMTYSPDGKLIAISGGVGIWLYDAADMTEVGLLQRHNSPVGSIDFSPDGKLLASTGWEDRTIRIWDVEAQEQIGVIGGQKDFMGSVLFSPDGKLLALIGGYDRQNTYEPAVRLWDVETRKNVAVMEGHEKGKQVYSLSFSPDGKLLATASMDRTARVWNLEEHTEAAVIAGDFGDVLFSPAGKLLVLGGIDGVIRLWDVAEREDEAVLKGHDAMVLGLSSSQDGKLLASSDSKKTIRLWDMEKKEQVTMLDGYDSDIMGMSFSSDGNHLAIAIWGGKFQIWDVAEQKEVAVVEGYNDYVLDISFSPDGSLLASGEGNAVRLWDVETRKEAAILDGFSSLSFSPDGKLLASKGGDNTIIKLWDMGELKEIGVLDNADELGPMLFSPDGKLLVSGRKDGPIWLWDVEKRQNIDVLKGHTGNVIDLSFSPDGKLLASGSDDNTVRLWNLEDGEEVAVLRRHTNAVCAVAFSPDGKLLISGGYDRRIRFWDMENPEKPLEVAALNTQSVEALCLSPDGKFLASGERDDAIKIWDVDKKKQVAVLKGHTWMVSSLSFSPDGGWLASGSYDGTVLLWEMNLDAPSDGRPVEPAGKQIGTWGEVKRSELYQNYPNPFNPDTWIPYQLAQEGDVAIRVYSASGQLMRTLDIGQKPAGAYISKEKAAHWDGRNSSGEKVASDVYFYTIQAEDFTATKKMVVAR
ncbi:sigma-70 family RNA polymerase sigma factor [Candidatus Poribacteria bacterium]